MKSFLNFRIELKTWRRPSIWITMTCPRPWPRSCPRPWPRSWPGVIFHIWNMFTTTPHGIWKESPSPRMWTIFNKKVPTYLKEIDWGKGSNQTIIRGHPIYINYITRAWHWKKNKDECRNLPKSCRISCFGQKQIILQCYHIGECLNETWHWIVSIMFHFILIHW